jgi:D-galactarolactone cycloisomerase
MPNPFRDELAAKPIGHAKGWVDVPAGSGLGIEVDRTVLERYRVA